MNEAQRSERRVDRLVGPHARPGYDRLWMWFGLSYAGWLTMPRVMMHAMPDDWQDRMAALLEEWDATWDSSEMPNTRVQAVATSGRMTRWPKWLLNYRYPDTRELKKLMRPNARNQRPA